MNGTDPNGRHVWFPSTRERFVYRTAGLILLLALVFMLRLLTWLAFPGDGFRDVQIQTPTAGVAGDLLRYTVAYCHGAAPGTVLVMRELELQDHGTDIQLPGIAYTTNADCETKARTVGIPSFTPAGPYRLRVTTELQVNPLRHVRQVWLSPEFQVIK